MGELLGSNPRFFTFFTTEVLLASLPLKKGMGLEDDPFRSGNFYLFKVNYMYFLSWKITIIHHHLGPNIFGVCETTEILGILF